MLAPLDWPGSRTAFRSTNAVASDATSAVAKPMRTDVIARVYAVGDVMWSILVFFAWILFFWMLCPDRRGPGRSSSSSRTRSAPARAARFIVIAQRDQGSALLVRVPAPSHLPVPVRSDDQRYVRLESISETTPRVSSRKSAPDNGRHEDERHATRTARPLLTGRIEPSASRLAHGPHFDLSRARSPRLKTKNYPKETASSQGMWTRLCSSLVRSEPQGARGRIIWLSYA